MGISGDKEFKGLTFSVIPRKDVRNGFVGGIRSMGGFLTVRLINAPQKPAQPKPGFRLVEASQSPATASSLIQADGMSSAEMRYAVTGLRDTGFAIRRAL